MTEDWFQINPFPLYGIDLAQVLVKLDQFSFPYSRFVRESRKIGRIFERLQQALIVADLKECNYKTVVRSPEVPCAIGAAKTGSILIFCAPRSKENRCGCCMFIKRVFTPTLEWPAPSIRFTNITNNATSYAFPKSKTLQKQRQH